MQKEIQLCIKHSYSPVDMSIHNMRIEVQMYIETYNLDVQINIIEEKVENQSA